MNGILFAVLFALSRQADAYQAPGKVEADLLKQLHGVERRGPKLLIHCLTKTVAFSDDGSDSTSSVYSYLAGSFFIGKNRRDYLVFQQYYEGWGYVLIDGDSGKEIRLYGKPELSPDRSRYASAFRANIQNERDPAVRVIQASDFSTEFSSKETKRDSWLSDSFEVAWRSPESFSVTVPITSNSHRAVEYVLEGSKWMARGSK